MSRIPLPPFPPQPFEKPVSPKEVAALKGKIFPNIVIRAINMLIAQKFSGNSAHFTQDEVIQAIIDRSGGDITREQIFQEHWLDFEPIYRAAGWKVEYDRPGYNETYTANFTFTIK